MEEVQPVEKLVKERFDPGLGDVRNDAALRDARVIASPPTLSRAARSVLLHLDDHFEVRLQELKDHLHRLVRLRRHVMEPDDVPMPGHLLEDFDLAVCSQNVSATRARRAGATPRVAHRMDVRGNPQSLSRKTSSFSATKDPLGSRAR